MNPSENLRVKVLLSIQRALLGEVPKDLRGVTCSYCGAKISIKCFFDGGITAADQESMETVATEIAADFPDHEVTSKSLQLDQPEPLSAHTLMDWVYWRKEEN
jgi:hypothetical protein